MAEPVPVGVRRAINYTRVLELIRLIEDDRSNSAAVLGYARALRQEIEGAADTDPPVHDYQVTWTIDVDAETPQAAARIARAIQRDPTSTATIFHVRLIRERGQPDDEQTIDAAQDEHHDPANRDP
jgi:hypothetical protein